MKINPIQIKTSNSEIGWMLGSPQNIFDKVYRYFLFVCWTVISPLVILAILIYYIIDVTVSTIFSRFKSHIYLKQNPPMYKRWNSETGTWMINEELTNCESDCELFEYDALGTAVIAVVHIIAVIPILIFIVKSFYKNKTFSFGNFKNDENAVIFRK